MTKSENSKLIWRRTFGKYSNQVDLRKTKNLSDVQLAEVAEIAGISPRGLRNMVKMLMVELKYYLES